MTEHSDVGVASAAGESMPESSVTELYASLEAVVDGLQQALTISLTPKQVAELAYTHERVARKLAGIGLQRVTDVQERAAFTSAGFTTIGTFLSTGLRLGRGPAGRRLAAANALCEQPALTGEVLPPRRPHTAAAVADGAISGDHVTVIETVLGKVPTAAGPEMLDDAEKQLAEAARIFSPTDLAKIGDRILAHLDPDGRLTDDTDRRRQRGLSLSPQDRQLMSTLKGQLTPTVRAMIEVILTAWAAPGMNNPADEQPLFGAGDDPELDQEALAEARARDCRSQAQRNHDALEAMCRYVLGHRGLGAPDRLPAEVVITTSLAELAGLSGFAHTATGTDLPIRDLIEVAAHANTWLQVFASHTQEVLYLGRVSRFANKAQRLALFGRDRGCTGPLCDTPFSRTEAHHAPDWAKGGVTDIDRLGAACGRHNRIVGTRAGQWETRILETGPHAGRMGWRLAGTDAPWQLNPIHRLDLPVTSVEVSNPPTAGPPARAAAAAARRPCATPERPYRPTIERYLNACTSGLWTKVDIITTTRLQT
ncbi:HNH endonuclease [Gordonia asplenii]|uniref:HNH endonuclease n=1 Tax=Gordonia asplenii TaxID=2725283 RepID=UPI0028B17EA1|nr:DUF222 domain-containing protein [Gordonia asplenii]